LLNKYEHLRYFAHVDRPLSSGRNHWNEIPINGIEVSPFAPTDFIVTNEFGNYRVLHNSDAHQLMDINEKQTNNVIELDTLDLDCLFRTLRS